MITLRSTTLSSGMLALSLGVCVLTAPSMAGQEGTPPASVEVSPTRNRARASLFEMHRGGNAAVVKLRNAHKLRALKQSQGADAIEIEEIDDGIRRLHRQSKEQRP